MTNAEILRIALEQSAIDANCRPEDLLQDENRVVLSAPNKAARAYLELPLYCNLISYGNNVVASVSGEIAEAVKAYIDRYPAEHCFETPNLHILDAALLPRGYTICFMAEYFLPDMDALQPLPCAYRIKLLGPEDFAALYTPDWSNALCRERRDRDILGVGAYDGEKLIALAGCSADCETMWQIGIDVLPEYRRQGLGSALTGRLALEVLDWGRVPFYCAAWSNIRSVRSAVKCGFRPAWAEMTAKSTDLVTKMNA